MSKTRPLFTVVMPAYGVEKYLAKAVESIESQTFQEWELIIVEDGSPDKTGSLVDTNSSTGIDRSNSFNDDLPTFYRINGIT